MKRKRVSEKIMYDKTQEDRVYETLDLLPPKHVSKKSCMHAIIRNKNVNFL